MYKDLKAIYDKTNTGIFSMSVSHLLSIGFNAAEKITDKQIASVKEQSWATAEFLQKIVSTAKEIAIACGNNPVELIQFCMVENVFDTEYYCPDKSHTISWDRMCELATNAIWGLVNNGGDWEEEFELAGIDLDDYEVGFFGIDDYIREKEDHDWY